MVINRHRTAITRKTLSVPVRLAIERGVLTPDKSVLDYGCGRGDDVRLLCEQGYNAWGFDPFYKPEPNDRWNHSGDVVFLSYVLNVIENPQERADVLRCAWSQVNQNGYLVATVRMGQPLPNCTPYTDGQLTRAGTFQKLYQYMDFVNFVVATLSMPHGATFRRLGSHAIMGVIPR